jgi:succinate dehydrogenase / fumarate reductase cytochrome b subunit
MEAVGVEPKGSIAARLNLRWLWRLFSSSIGRKFVMALSGLALCGFLVVHLAGNLFLYGGAEKFNRYALGLHEQEWLPFAEFGLFVLFVLHIYLGFTLTLENQLKRKTAYARKESKITDRPLVFLPSNWMFISGLVVLAFLVLHIVDMRLAIRPDLKYVMEEDETAPFLNTLAVLSNPISQVVYIVGTIFLGFHLAHGFSSAFQSLGLNHPKYMPLIKWFGVLFAIVIAIGFCSLPVLIGFFRSFPSP